MIKKHTILIALTISILLLIIASCYYPGGSQINKNAIGYNWRNNYISNLFGRKAVNGADNPARFWAVTGMFFLSAGVTLFFVRFSNKIPANGAALIIKYVGGLGMVFTFLIATPLHDIMITIASTLYLIGMFYITVFVLRSKLHLLKICCIICLLIFYGMMCLYGFGMVTYLPIMQKLVFATTIALILGLEYFTGKEDFEPVR